MTNPEVVIVGAGLAGLRCATELAQNEVPTLLLERSDGVGGRARTDVVDGFLLDRGFQTLRTAYPEAHAAFDYRALELKALEPGALVRLRSRFHRVTDSWRRPIAGLLAALNPVGTLGDKARLAQLRRDVREGSIASLFTRPERTARERLADYGFSEPMTKRFLEPYIGAIFLDRELSTSSRMLDFELRMMANGDSALPARGIGALAEQLAARLPEGTLRLKAAVKSLSAWQVELESGESIPAKAVVVATDGDAAAGLTRRMPAPAWRAATCMYFAADRAPVDEAILVLDGEGTGPVNHLCVPSHASRAYAPPGAALVSATVLGSPEMDDDALEREVRAQLTSWFGGGVAGWKKLATYRIARAKPAQGPRGLPAGSHSVHFGELFVCGDHRDLASIQGALSSGRRAAEAVMAKLAARPALV